jgi:hypothetical protein
MPSKSIDGMLGRLHPYIAMTGAIVMSIAWLVPNHYPPWISFYNEAVMAVGLILLAAAVLLLRPKNGQPSIVFWLCLASAIPWIQYAFGLVEFSGDAWVSTLYLFGIAGSVAIGFSWGCINKKSLPVLLSISLLFAACVSSILGIVQVFHGGILQIWGLDGAPGMRAQANLGQPNHLATLIGFGCVSLLLLFEQRLLGRLVSATILGLLVVGIGLTQSRTALLFGPVLAVLLWIFSRRSPGVFRTKHGMVWIVSICHWLIAFLWPSLQTALLISTPSSLDIAEAGVQTTRWQAWLMFADAATESPLFGYGWLQTGAAQLQVAAKFPVLGELFLSTHNFFLEMIIWCGLPIGLTISGLVLYWFWTRMFRVHSLESMCGFLLAVVLAIHSMSEFPYRYSYFLIPAALWVGYIEYAIGNKEVFARKVNLLVYASGVALFVLIWRDYSYIESEFRTFRFEQQGIGFGSPVEKADVATPFSSGLVAYMRIHRATRAGDASEQDLRRLIERYPYGNTMYQYALRLAEKGDLDGAQDMFLRLRNIHGLRAERDFTLDLGDRVSRGAVQYEQLWRLVAKGNN